MVGSILVVGTAKPERCVDGTGGALGIERETCILLAKEGA
jgi:hypothetical protein